MKNLFKDKPEQNETIINDWKKDQNGCLKLRTKKLAIELMYSAKYIPAKTPHPSVMTHDNKDSDKFHMKKLAIDAEVLVYYFDTLCDVQEQDKCYAEFYFKSGLLTSTEFLCE